MCMECPVAGHISAQIGIDPGFTQCRSKWLFLTMTVELLLLKHPEIVCGLP